MDIKNVIIDIYLFVRWPPKLRSGTTHIDSYPIGQTIQYQKMSCYLGPKMPE